MEFLLFFCIFPDFLKKKYQNSEKITAFFSRFHSQILQNNLVFWQFSIVPRHVEGYGKLPNLYQSGLGGLWKRLIDFLPTCHKGLHDHLRSVMSMHFWRFFHFFEIFCMFWVNWTIERSPVLKKKFKKISGASCSRTLHSWNATRLSHTFCMKRRLDKHKDGEDADIDTSRYKSYTRRHEGIRHIQLYTLGDFVPATVTQSVWVTCYQKLELLSGSSAVEKYSHFRYTLPMNQK